MRPIKIRWQHNLEVATNWLPLGFLDWLEPVAFPPPWLKRPWIYAVMVASANGVVAWKRKPGEEHPVHTILGGDPHRPERIADLIYMRFLRCFGDCSVGAETQRDQRGLIQTPEESWERSAYQDLQKARDMLYRFRREAQGLTRHPKNIRYSPSGRLDLSDPLFSAPGVEVIVVTTEEGAERLEAAGSEANGAKLIVEPKTDKPGPAR